MMDFETKVRAALRDDEVGPPGLAWEAFERAARRSRVRRVAASGLVALVLIGTAIVFVPRAFRDGTTGSFVDEPGGPASEEHHVDRTAGYSLRIPAGWSATAEAGVETGGTIVIQRDGAATSGADAFTLRVTPERPRSYTQWLARFRTVYVPRLEQIGVDVTESEFAIGRRAHGFGMIFPEKPTSSVPPDITWCAGCRHAVYLVDWHDAWVLTAAIEAGSARAFERDGPAGLEMLTSLKRSEVYSAAPTHGVVDASVPMDDATHALVTWLNARVEGEFAEWGVAATGAPMDTEWLFAHAHPDPRHPIVRWKVVSREGVDANSFEYVIVLHARTADGEESFSEIVAWGPGRNLEGEDRAWLSRSARSPE